MSRLRANEITNRMANGAPTASNGLVISGVSTHVGLSQFQNTINLTHASAGQNYIYFNEDLQFAKNGTGTRLKIDSKGQISSSGSLTAFDGTSSINGLQMYYETDSGVASLDHIQVVVVQTLHFIQMLVVEQRLKKFASEVQAKLVSVVQTMEHQVRC